MAWLRVTPWNGAHRLWMPYIRQSLLRPRSLSSKLLQDIGRDSSTNHHHCCNKNCIIASCTKQWTGGSSNNNKKRAAMWGKKKTTSRNTRLFVVTRIYVAMHEWMQFSQSFDGHSRTAPLRVGRVIFNMHFLKVAASSCFVLPCPAKCHYFFSTQFVLVFVVVLGW